MTAVQKKRFTPTEYLRLERAADYRSQYWEGEIFAMSGGSREHNEIATNLLVRIGSQLLDGRCRVYGSDMRVRQSADKYVYADLSLVCGEPRFEDADVDTLLNPLAVIEILSPTTESFDRGKKFAGYRQIASLREYVLVAQDEPLVERFTLVDDGWKLSEARGLDATFEVAGVHVALADVYRRVTFG